MPSVSITWHTSLDNRVCPVCKALEGYTWTFENQVPNSLTHPQFGEVWNTTIGSAAHEKGMHGQCRCHIEPKFDLTDLVERVKKLRDEIKKEYSEIDDTKSGSYRKTTAEDLGIDLSKYGL